MEFAKEYSSPWAVHDPDAIAAADHKKEVDRPIRRCNRTQFGIQGEGDRREPHNANQESIVVGPRIAL